MLFPLPVLVLQEHLAFYMSFGYLNSVSHTWTASSVIHEPSNPLAIMTDILMNMHVKELSLFLQDVQVIFKLG